jgi:O-methyltransferase
MDSGADLYIELLKHCVSNYIYDDDVDLLKRTSIDPASGKQVVVDPAQFDPRRMKYYGAMWPSRAHTMIGIPRLDNIRNCVEEVLQNGVQGDLIEAGAWRGGASIFMRGILKAYGVTDRRVWVADSFAGLPPADRVRYPKESTAEFHRYKDLAVSLDEVRRNFERYGLLDDQVQFIKGWFRDTLPAAPIDQLAVMRLDGDMYESTMDTLVHLYPKLSPGGFVIIDDYNMVKACDAAVEDFRREEGITSELSLIPVSGAFWRKEPAARAGGR